MARIVETFRQNGETLRLLSEPDPVVAEIPYVEVGPRKHIESSMDLTGLVTEKAPRAKPPVRQSQGPTFRRLPKDEPVPLPFAVQLVAYHAPKDSASVQYAELLETIVDAAQAVNKSSKILGFTAVRAGVGCTTVVLNLAISAAMQGKRVIVVDANLRDSAVAKRLGMSEHPGLTELLAGVATLTEVLRETGLANLQVLTSGTPAPLWADRRTLTQTLEKIGQNADLVFIDAPTQQDRAADLVAGVSEATFLVVPQNEAETENTGALLESLPLRGLPLAGCIVTQ